MDIPQMPWEVPPPLSGEPGPPGSANAISGKVGENGEVLIGTEFNCFRVAGGVYEIAYKEPHENFVPVVSKSNDNQNSGLNINVFEITNNGFVVSFDLAGEGTDESFTFISASSN